MSPVRKGVASAIGAFFLWGLLPIFWKSLHFLPPATIIAQRTLWSMLLLLPLIAWRGQFREVSRVLITRQGFTWQLLSGSLLASNWLLYVWATLNGRILEGALGYYLNPFFNMLFGALFFGERQTRRQLIAVAVALVGVGCQFPSVNGPPWVALALALTFSLYAVVRKKAALGALGGLAAETALLAPIAASWLLWQHHQNNTLAGHSIGEFWLVAATGLATATPLLLFNHATRSIPLTTLGMLQFLGPTLQFMVGWGFYGEPMNGSRLISFALIWLAIAIHTSRFRSRPAIAPE
ncbi:MAG: EamA family transporter RarD [Verrucomicrobia bacterium]|nr:MAG: EamA family transporter RarD [Verrucomicrobiota bacterium]TAE85257.1 MAG: EamA family transporter RarD [Verrucomicrobiota bacterium]TAF22698.1 MAG: EamA family transporter RarD [Verrucomicrobiota bacterium]TAF39910.1 MAG: EamA family transporter RarD [Verrucomicrobiota bacterium]